MIKAIKRYIIVLVFFIYCILPSAFSKTIIIYPKGESTKDTRAKYPIELLKRALKKSGTDYSLQASKTKMQQKRALFQLEIGSTIDVFWSMTSLKRENSLLPIRIPIYKGLIGWRVFLIDKKDIKKFQRLENIDDLKKLKAGQGHDWPDTKILIDNGFLVKKSATYDGLFLMLEKNRFDYFPRSVTEIWGELDKYRFKNIVVEKNIMIRYPTALYYFVNKKNKTLYKDIKNGLEKMIVDGSFDKLFHQYFDEILIKTDIKNRKVFDIKNPLLSKETPLEKKELWLSN